MDPASPLISMLSPRRILIIQLKRLGDVILTTPIPELLKRRWPQARVDFLVDQAFAPVLDHHPSIGRVQVYDRSHVWETIRRIRSEQYDRVIDFQCSPRSSLIVHAGGAPWTAGYRVPFWGNFYKETVKRPDGRQTVVEGKVSLIAPWAGPISDVPEPRIYLTPQEREWAREIMAQPPSQEVIGLVPTHRRPSRRWKPESFAQVARLFDQRGAAVWLFWGPNEQGCVEFIQRIAPKAKLIPPATVRQMAALLERCRMVISNDNGPMHLAVAVGVPTVTLYGPTHPGSWNLGGLRNAVVQAEGLSCLGCNLNDCPFGHECMARIEPQRVFEISQHLLESAYAAQS